MGRGKSVEHNCDGCGVRYMALLSGLKRYGKGFCSISCSTRFNQRAKRNSRKKSNTIPEGARVWTDRLGAVWFVDSMLNGCYTIWRQFQGEPASQFGLMGYLDSKGAHPVGSVDRETAETALERFVESQPGMIRKDEGNRE